MLNEGWPTWSDQPRRVVQFGMAIFHLLLDADDLDDAFSSFECLLVGLNLILDFKVVIPASTDLSTNIARALVTCSGSVTATARHGRPTRLKGSYSVDVIPYTSLMLG